MQRHVALLLWSLLIGLCMATEGDFRYRPGWNQLGPEVLSLIETRLTPAELQKFIRMSESLDLVRKHYLPLAGAASAARPQKAQFVVGTMAVLFTDIGNQYGEKKDLKNAGTFAAMALKLNPNHVPAMFTLIEVYLRTANCPAAKSLIDMGRSTLARLRAVPAEKLPEHNRSAVGTYDAMDRQLDLFAKSCPP